LNAEVRNNLGLLYYSRGMTGEAIDEFRRAIAVNPGYVKAPSNLAVVLTSAGRLAEARAELRVALEVAPNNGVGTLPEHAIAHYNLAILYEEHDSVALAVHHYKAFLKYAGPEHGSTLTDVQRRVRLLEPKLQPIAN
jgi:tetratricopeptide (TPR) repeat protein